jgi:hypothetical protein
MTALDPSREGHVRQPDFPAARISSASVVVVRRYLGVDNVVFTMVVVVVYVQFEELEMWSGGG